MYRLVISNPEKQLKNGFEKCRQMHPKVSMNGAIGSYKVKGNENIYNVNFSATIAGKNSPNVAAKRTKTECFVITSRRLFCCTPD